MNILYIWDADYPWDIRVEKVCNTLLKHNHDVHMVCRNIKRQPLSIRYKGIYIHRLRCLPRFMGKLNTAFSFPAFFSPIWLWEIFRQTQRNRCQLIIIRDLPMALSGILIGRLLNIPTLLDMAECYPEMLRCTWKFEGFKLRNLFLRNPLLADIVEKMVLRLADHVLVMVEESKARLIAKKIDQRKIHIVSNTPELDRFLSLYKEYYKERDLRKNKVLRLLYVGLLNPSRGLDTVIMAVKRYIKYNPDFIFKIVGDGKDYYRLKKMVETNSLEGFIIFTGWLDNKDIPSIIFDTDICIVPHHLCSHWETTIPNKLFDYMAARKPVVVSNVAPMKRIVRETKCGFVYEDYDIDGLVQTLKSLEDSKIRYRLGTNGYNAVVSCYNWKTEEAVLKNIIDGISARYY